VILRTTLHVGLAALVGLAVATGLRAVTDLDPALLVSVGGTTAVGWLWLTLSS
jgi:hypothetical protein